MGVLIRPFARCLHPQVLQQFSREAVRKAFVQKVYGIVATQLAATGAVVAFLRSMPHVPFEILRRLGPLFFLLPLGPLLMLQLMPNTRTSGSASAYLLLAAFTILQATVIGAGCAKTRRAS